jgi:hypothetical protein
MRRLSRAEVLASEPCFLLTIYWSGRRFRFASFPLTLSSDDGLLRFNGALSLADFVDALPRSGVVQDGADASLEVVFAGLNVAGEYFAGRPLETATCELSMILHRSMTTDATWEGRIVLMVGRATGVQFGWPDRDPGWAALTVTARTYDDDAPLIDPAWRVNNGTFTYWNNGGTNDDAAGSVYPIVIGQPGDAQIMGSPSFRVDTRALQQKVFLSVGRLDATQVVVLGDDGTRDNSVPVVAGVDGRGTVYSYGDIGSSGTLTKTLDRYYVGWASGGGGLLNPYGSGPLTRAADVIRWAFSRGAYGAEAGAWEALLPTLSRYKFAGYINDPTVTAWQWLRDEILEFLPIKVRIGSDGAYPVSLLPLLPTASLPAIQVGDSWGVEQVSPFEVTTPIVEVINDFSIEYYTNAKENKNTKSLRATGDTRDPERARVASAEISHATYGHRPGPAVVAGFVYDDNTAHLMLQDRARDKGFLSMSTVLSARPAYGWLHVGDQISLTMSRYDLTGHRATVLTKRWDAEAARWVFEVGLSQTPLDHNLP